MSASQWRIDTYEGSKLQPGQRFSLYSEKNGSYLRYEKRKYGINLGWTSKDLRNFLVERDPASGEEGSIKRGERVALKQTVPHADFPSGGYVVYEKRDPLVINLGWSHDPVYEWKFPGGAGTVVRSGARVALHNLVAPKPDIVPWCGEPGASVVYGWRARGIALVWDPPGVYYSNYWDDALVVIAALAMGQSPTEYLAKYKDLHGDACKLAVG